MKLSRWPLVLRKPNWNGRSTESQKENRKREKESDGKGPGPSRPPGASKGAQEGQYMFCLSMQTMRSPDLLEHASDKALSIAKAMGHVRAWTQALWRAPWPWGPSELRGDLEGLGES